jgi:hypothetical protein
VTQPPADTWLKARTLGAQRHRTQPEAIPNNNKKKKAKKKKKRCYFLERLFKPLFPASICIESMLVPICVQLVPSVEALYISMVNISLAQF